MEIYGDFIGIDVVSEYTVAVVEFPHRQRDGRRDPAAVGRLAEGKPPLMIPVLSLLPPVSNSFQIA